MHLFKKLSLVAILVGLCFQSQAQSIAQDLSNLPEPANQTDRTRRSRRQR